MSTLRDAASLLVLQQTGENLNILMGIRHANHKFMPNRLVFPGGSVDDEDFSAPAATPLRAETLALLKLSACPELSAALGYAAARELAEETGLTLGTPPNLSGLHYLCRAETPAESPIRFNARFFTVNASQVSGTLAGSGELEALDWYGLDFILQHDLTTATRAVLKQLQIWLGFTEAQRQTRKPPLFRDRAWTTE